MKSRNLYLIVTFAFALLLASFLPMASAVSQGVRTAGLRIQYYSDPVVMYAALQAGSIDFMDWPLSHQQYLTAITDPTIELGPVSENGMREFDLNGNETIASQPGVNSPTSYWQFRAALACLTDKQYLVQSVLGGFATRMDVPIVVNAPSWVESSVVYPNYPWEYSPTKAAKLLDDNGFVQGNTVNPDYDSGFPGSAQHLRVYPQCAPVTDNPQVGTDITGPPYVWPLTFHVCQPVTQNVLVMGQKVGDHLYTVLPYTYTAGSPDAHNEVPVEITVAAPTVLTAGSYLWIQYNTTHPMAGQDMLPIILYARSDDPQARLIAGQLLRDNMRKAGISVDFRPLPSTGTKPPVMTARDYHIYTGGWSLGRYPTSLYGLYETSHWYPNGADYIAPPCPRPSPGISAIDPNLDIYCKDVYYTTDIPSAILSSKPAEIIIVNKCVNIPLWTAASFYAWRTYMLGVVNEMGYGPFNGYTFLNAYKAAGAPEPTVLRVGINQAPQSGNVLFAQWTYDYAILDRMWEGGITFNPYDLGRDQPWVVQDWTPTTWVDPDDASTKTACIFWLRKDVSWAAPETGNYLRPFTAHDIEFGNMFYYFWSDGWNWDNVADVDHIQIIDDYTVEIYFSSVSYWFQYAATYPLLPKNEWGAKFCTPTTYTELGASYAAGDSLYLNEGAGHGVAQVDSITVGGAPYTNYWVRFNGTGDAFSANRIYFNAPVAGDLVIHYWNITGDATGFYPGSDTDWQSISYSIGEYIMTQVTTDWTVFKRNNYFFLQTPPLGEVDMYWWWGARDTSRPLGGPRMGKMTVDIYDVTFSTVAYGSSGYMEPTTSPPWFPGADLAPTYTPDVPFGGLIDIYDVSTILVSYGTDWGIPPV